MPQDQRSAIWNAIPCMDCSGRVSMHIVKEWTVRYDVNAIWWDGELRLQPLRHVSGMTDELVYDLVEVLECRTVQVSGVMRQQVMNGEHDACTKRRSRGSRRRSKGRYCT